MLKNPPAFPNMVANLNMSTETPVFYGIPGFSAKFLHIFILSRAIFDTAEGLASGHKSSK